MILQREKNNYNTFIQYFYQNVFVVRLDKFRNIHLKSVMSMFTTAYIVR